MQTQILDRYEGVYGAAVHSLASGVAADQMVVEQDLAFPMVYDFDSEILRQLRLAKHLFPLEVVIDAEGELAYVGSNFAAAVDVVAGLARRPGAGVSN